jgi:hypothetical protein
LKFHFLRHPWHTQCLVIRIFGSTNTCKKEFRMELALAQDWVKRGIYEFMEKGLPYLDFWTRWSSLSWLGPVVVVTPLFQFKSWFQEN